MVLMISNRLNLGKLKVLHGKEPGEKYVTGPFFALFQGLAEDIWEGRGGIVSRHNLKSI